MYKKALLNAAAIAVAGLLSQGAFAADGTINFEGEIVDQPCSISPKSQNLTVPLGKVARTKLDGGAGKKATPSLFTIDLLGCGDTAKGASVTFTGTPDFLVPTDLRIGVGSVDNSTATGVAVEIGDSAGAKIDLGSESGRYTLVPGDNSLKFQAVYVSTGPTVTTGIANATAQFTVTYK